VKSNYLMKEKFISPARFVNLLVVSLFLAELLIMFLLSKLNLIEDSNFLAAVLDSFLIVTLLTPGFYFWIYRPLGQSYLKLGMLKESLQNANQDLEQKVIERTRELEILNKLLRKDYIEELKLSEEKYKGLLNSLGLGVAVIDNTLKVLDFNAKMKEWFPDIENSADIKCSDIFKGCKSESKCNNCPLVRTLRDHQMHETTTTLHIKDQVATLRLISSPTNAKAGEERAVTLLIEDVTSKHYANQQLQESEEKFRALTEAASDAILITNDQGDLTYINHAGEKMFGVLADEVIGKSIHSTVIPGQPDAKTSNGIRSFRETGKGKVIGTTIETNGRTASGEDFPVELSISSYKVKDKWQAVGIIRNCSKRKEYENKIRELNEDLENKVVERTKELQEAQQVLKNKIGELNTVKEIAEKAQSYHLTLFDNLPGLIWTTDIEGKVDFVNKPLIDLIGLGIEDIKGDFWMSLFHPEDVESCKEVFITAFQKAKPFDSFFRIPNCTGEYIWLYNKATPLHNLSGEFLGYVGLCVDITEQRTIEESLRTNKERYKSLLKNSSEGIFVLEPYSQNIQEVNDRFLAMLGFNEGDIIGRKYNEIVVDDPEKVSRNIQKLIQEGEFLQVKRQFRRQDGTLLDVELSGSVITYNQEKICLYNVRDISERKQAEFALQGSFEKLKATLAETVNALVAVAEKRDPYTAGHQRRVAKLAVAIALALGLSEEQREGIRIAGLLHDIGKIYVPTDILNKPGRLTDMEMAIIKTHSEVGYEIVSKIPFETPVAKMILQHHERLNGSGYPNGLKGEEILIESRILGVADVVEAMASHRPYRPAIGIEEALAEITINKGEFYCPKVVEACLKIFERNDFDFG